MELLERFVRGDLDAFESVFRDLQGIVYGWIVRIVRDPAAAEDLTIETFWRVYRARARFDPARGLNPWVHRIATNLAYNHLRAVRHETPLVGDVPQTTVADSRFAAIRRAFAGLPARLREAAEPALIDERPYAEIAKHLAISEGAVNSRVFRAVRLLRTKLKRMGVEA